MKNVAKQDSHAMMMARDRLACAATIHQMYAGRSAALVGSHLKIHTENLDQVLAGLVKCHHRRDMYNLRRFALKMGGLFVDLNVVYLSMLCHELARHAEKGQWRSVRGLIETLSACWPSLRQDIIRWTVHYLE